MTKISLLAKLTVADEHQDALAGALDALIAAAAEEPGLEIYSAHQDPNEPSLVYFFEVYSDEAALGVHGKGEQMRAAMKTLGGLLAGAPEVTMLTPLAAKGIEL